MAQISLLLPAAENTKANTNKAAIKPNNIETEKTNLVDDPNFSDEVAAAQSSDNSNVKNKNKEESNDEDDRSITEKSNSKITDENLSGNTLPPQIDNQTSINNFLVSENVVDRKNSLASGDTEASGVTEASSSGVTEASGDIETFILDGNKNKSTQHFTQISLSTDGNNKVILSEQSPKDIKDIKQDFASIKLAKKSKIKIIDNKELNESNKLDIGTLLKHAKLVVSNHKSIDAIYKSLKDKVNIDSPITTENRNHQHISQPLDVQRSELPQLQLNLKVNDAQANMSQLIDKFAPAMKQQLIAMVNQGIQQAEFKIDPPELGQMMVRVMVNGDQTLVHFNVSQQNTRELVEQALPRLKEMLSEQGLELADGQVSQDNNKDKQAYTNNEDSYSYETVANDERSDTRDNQVSIINNGIDSKSIDYYA